MRRRERNVTDVVLWAEEGKTSHEDVEEKHDLQQIVGVVRVLVHAVARAEYTWKSADLLENAICLRQGTYTIPKAFPTDHNATKPATLYATFFRLRSEKLDASRRLTISSSFGCRHVPV